MPKFADVLKMYEHKIESYRKLSVEVNVDRTTLKRYVAGERLPKNIETVKAIAGGIGLTEDEENCLLEAYRISQMGEKKYRGYQIIEQIFGGGSAKYKQFLLDCDKKIEFDNNAPTDFVKIQKIMDVRSALAYMCNKASNLKILAQPGELYGYIRGSVYNNKDCCLELLLQLDGRHSRDDIVELDYFAKVYDLLGIGKSCEVYALYSYMCDVKTVGVNYIISDKGVLVFNILDGKEVVGFYTEKPDVKEYYEAEFNKYRTKGYTYAISSRHFIEVKRKSEKVLDNVDSNVTFEICKVDNSRELWIMNNRYIRIMELSMIELFDKYMDEYTKD